MKNTKRTFNVVRPFLAMILALLFLAECGSEAKAELAYNVKVTEATQDFYINDFAGIFTEDQKANMMEKAVKLSDDYSGIQVVITTVKSLQECITEEKNGIDIEEVAYSMYNQYGIGKNDMGILVLFSSGDRKVRIETGYQMQTYLTDSKSGQLLDNYGMEYFKQDQFAEGLISLQNGIISEIMAIVPADWNDFEEPLQSTSPAVIPEDETPSQGQMIEETKKEQASVGVFTLVSVLGTILIGIVVSIKKFFSTKKKLEKSNDEKEQLEKQLEEQAKQYEEKIQKVQDSCSQKLKQTEQRHETEKEVLIKDAERQCEAERLAKESAEGREQDLKNVIKEMNDISNSLKQELAVLQEKYDRMQKLHPELDFEAEVKEMIEKEFRMAAAEIDKGLAKYLDMPADKESISEFQMAIDKYESTDPQVKQYLKTDVNRLYKLRDESRILKFKAEAERADERLAQYLTMPADKDRVLDFKNAIHEYETTKSEIQRYMKTDIEKLRQLYKESCSLKAEYERAEQEKRDRAKAQRVYEELLDVSGRIRKGTHENQRLLEDACRKYDSLEMAEKEFFTDITLVISLQKLLQDAQRDTKIWEEAKEVESSIQSTVSRVGYRASESDKSSLERAMRKYRGISSDHQAYVSDELIAKLKMLIREAEEDEEENRRRRDSFISGSSSFGGGISGGSFGGGFSGGGFGGFGGHSSGGGASRGF